MATQTIVTLVISIISISISISIIIIIHRGIAASTAFSPVVHVGVVHVVHVGVAHVVHVGVAHVGVVVTVAAGICQAITTRRARPMARTHSSNSSSSIDLHISINNTTDVRATTTQGTPRSVQSRDNIGWLRWFCLAVVDFVLLLFWVGWLVGLF